MTNEIDVITDDLLNFFNQTLQQHSDILNPSILERKPILKLEADVYGCVSYCFTVLNEICRRYRVATSDCREFVVFDVKRLCLLLFKPYFTNDELLKQEVSKYTSLSTHYKTTHDVIDLDPPDDIYNSIIVYLKDFIIDLAM